MFFIVFILVRSNERKHIQLIKCNSVSHMPKLIKHEINTPAVCYERISSKQNI